VGRDESRETDKERKEVRNYRIRMGEVPVNIVRGS
jgi:hypothetical protein